MSSILVRSTPGLYRTGSGWDSIGRGVPELLTFQTDAIPLDGSDCLLDSRLVRYQTTVCMWVWVCKCMRVRVC